MIFITARFRVLAEHADNWVEITSDFTKATRAEAGCLWFDWSRSVDDPTVYVLVEAFESDEAGAEHVQSEHFQQARATLPSYLVETPQIVNFAVPGSEWSELGELSVVS
jgi:quinol monooxygenase YgiN